MKKVLFLMASLVVLTSCKVDSSAWSGETIDPSDNIVTKEYKLTAFEEVNMQSVGDVELIQSEKKDGVVELTAPENYIELYEFESEGGKLDIKYARKHINLKSMKVKIKVYTCDLVKLCNGGAASIRMDSLDTDKIVIENSGVGSITISGLTDDAELICSGVGSINAHNLKALNVKAIVSGVGSITCYASENLEGRVTGVGSLKYAGNPQHKNNKRTGVGSITAM